MNNQLNLPEDKELAKEVLNHQKDQSKIENGFLGKIWGGSSSVPNNTAAFIALILVLVGVAHSLFPSLRHETQNASELWSIITPIITLCVGYLFGNKLGR